MPRCCAVSGCESSGRDFGTFLFIVPADGAPRRRWAKALARASLPESSSVCWNHFEPCSLRREGLHFELVPDAIPTRFLGTGNGLEGAVDGFCRFCAQKVNEEVGNDLTEMHVSEDSRTFLNYLLSSDVEDSPSRMVCDECLLQAKLAMRFIRSCEKASRELEGMVREKGSAESDVKTEMDEFGEIPIGSVEPEVKMEVSSLGGFSDREDEDSDYEDNIPLARRVHREKPKEEVETETVGPLSCALCDFTCSKPKQLAGHRKKHNNQEPTEESTTMEEDERGEPSSKSLQCPDCPYICERLNQLASHRKKHTGRKTKKDQPEVNRKEFYECEFCDFTCKQRRQMAGHRASHSNMIKQSKPSGKERDHMCSICGKILSTRGSFFVHMKYHNDQRDYDCQLCDKKFYSKRDVAMHVESFHEKKTFECEVCGVKCTWKNALYKHMRKHDSNSFKHECTYCGKKFIAANELRVHIWRHTGQQLNCEICGAGYRFNFLLTQHKIREHGAQVEGVKLYKRFQKGKGKGTAKRKDLSDQQPEPEHQPTFHEVGTQPMPAENAGSFQQVSNY